MSLRTVFVVFRKELLDMLRDKRTLIAMIGIPIVLYPALFIVGSQALLMQQGKVSGSVVRVAVSGVNVRVLRSWLGDIDKVSVVQSQAPDADLQTGRVQAIVSSSDDIAAVLAAGQTARISVQYDAAEGPSVEAARRLVEGLDARFNKLLESRVKTLGVSPDYVRPLEVERKNVAPPAKSTGTLLGMIMPLIMIVMLGIGALVPAVDLTAGEKERGTFETLLSTPASSIEILAGKFLTVFCLAMFTGALNLGSMVTAFTFQLSQISDSIGRFEVHVPMENVLLIAIALVPLAFFISAVMMSIAILARSFREAQSLLTPFLLFLLFPAGLAAIPGVSLTTATQFVPVVNVALMFKDLMTDQVNGEAIFFVLLSTTLYAILALALAARIFQREEVVLSHDRGMPLTLRRARFKPRALPTVGGAVFLFTVCLLLIYYPGTYVQTKYAFAGIAITQWGLFFAPTLVFLWFLRIDVAKSLSLRWPGLLILAGAGVAACGWVTLDLQFAVWQDKILPFPAQLAEEMEKLVHGQPLWLVILVVAVSPAICEETVFRGAILSGLRRSMPVWVLCVVVGVLFGLMHLSIHRLALTALSGAVLTYLVWRSGSIFTGMIAHGIINGAPVVLESGQTSERIGATLKYAVHDGHGFPLPILAASIGVFVLGILLVELSARRQMAREGASVKETTQRA